MLRKQRRVDGVEIEGVLPVLLIPTIALVLANRLFTTMGRRWGKFAPRVLDQVGEIPRSSFSMMACTKFRKYGSPSVHDFLCYICSHFYKLGQKGFNYGPN